MKSSDLDTEQRHKLDRALGGRAFVVDELACHANASELARSRRMPSVRNSSLSTEAQLLVLMSVIAICHQINWDFLRLRIEQALRNRDFDPEFLVGVTAADMNLWLEGYHKPERIRAKERAGMLRDFGATLISKFQGKVERLLSCTSGRIYQYGGLIETLDQFQAFREDPLRKKSSVLVHEIVRERLYSFADEREIKPAIDYHIMRLYLRTGRVVPIHQETFQLLGAPSWPRRRLITLLRETVSDALSLTALYANTSVPELNGIEWSLGRDICLPVDPRCLDPDIALIDSIGFEQHICPLCKTCVGFSEPKWRLLQEPSQNSTHY